MLPVVILCGGLASRLYPMTQQMPKSLIKVHGKPFIFHQLELLRQNHVTDVIMCVGNFGDAVEQFVGSEKYGINIKYSYDGKTLLGTGGAIKNALHLLPDTFIVLYGDSYLDVSFKPIIDKFNVEKKPILMTVYHNNNKDDKSNILFIDGNILEYNKKHPTQLMEHLDYGISIMTKHIFDSYPEIFDLADLLSGYVKIDEVSAFESKVPFFEIGSFSGIEKFKKHIKGEQNDYRN